MSGFIDLTGQRFGRLVVIKRSENIGRYTAWLCECDCGKEVVVKATYLRSGGTKSCGCLWLENHLKRRKTHGDSKARLYHVWTSIKDRCNNKNNSRYASYGGRGIRICEEWNKSYERFKEWAIQAGYDENAKFGKCTIDRIDNDGDYEPSNCRWADMSTQRRNQRRMKGFYV